MKKIFSFSYMATNLYMLIAVTMSYISFPILAFISVHTVCVFIGISMPSTQFAAATSFLVVGIYSLIGIIIMYRYYFKFKKRK